MALPTYLRHSRYIRQRDVVKNLPFSLFVPMLSFLFPLHTSTNLDYILPFIPWLPRYLDNFLSSNPTFLFSHHILTTFLSYIYLHIFLFISPLIISINFRIILSASLYLTFTHISHPLYSSVFPPYIIILMVSISLFNNYVLGNFIIS